MPSSDKDSIILQIETMQKAAIDEVAKSLLVTSEAHLIENYRDYVFLNLVLKVIHFFKEDVNYDNLSKREKCFINTAEDMVACCEQQIKGMSRRDVSILITCLRNDIYRSATHNLRQCLVKWKDNAIFTAFSLLLLELYPDKRLGVFIDEVEEAQRESRNLQLMIGDLREELTEEQLKNKLLLESNFQLNDQIKILEATVSSYKKQQIDRLISKKKRKNIFGLFGKV